MTASETTTDPQQEAFLDRMDARHASEVDAGLHDPSCEYARNFMLCNCRKRQREATGYTTLPGELIQQHPICPRCSNEVYHNADVFVCDTCHVSWTGIGGGDKGRFNDDNGELRQP